MGLDEITAWSTVAIAVITLGYAIVTWRMLNASTQSIALTLEIFEKSHRPYIVIESVCLIKEANETIALRPILYNCGSVPAAISEIVADFKILEDNLKVTVPNETFSISPLTKDSHLTFTISESQDTLPGAQLLSAAYKEPKCLITGIGSAASPLIIAG